MLLSIRGDARLRNRAADEMNFVEGALWSEAGAGTNAVGTALAAEHAVQVFAAEHFTEPVQRWTCAAAPVTRSGHRARCSAIIDLTGDMPACTRTASRSSSRPPGPSRSSCAAGMRERDDRLRARYGACSRPAGGPARRSSPRSGRVLLDPTSTGRSAARPRSRPAAARSCSRPALEAVAEPVEDGDALSRPPARAARARGAAAQLELRLLGAEPEVVARRPRGPPAPAPRRAARPADAAPRAGRTPTSCAPSSTATTATRRASASRCRACASCCRRDRPASYGLACDVESDPRHVRALLGHDADRRRRGAPTRARCCRLVRAPGIAARARSSRAGCARPSSPPTTPRPCGRGSGRRPATTTSWPGKRLLAALDYADARRSLAAPHGPPRSGARPCSGPVTPRVIH